MGRWSLLRPSGSATTASRLRRRGDTTPLRGRAGHPPILITCKRSAPGRQAAARRSESPLQGRTGVLRPPGGLQRLEGCLNLQGAFSGLLTPFGCRVTHDPWAVKLPSDPGRPDRGHRLAFALDLPPSDPPRRGGQEGGCLCLPRQGGRVYVGMAKGYPGINNSRSLLFHRWLKFHNGAQ